MANHQTHRRNARAGAHVLGPRRPPEPDDQVPATQAGLPAIEEALVDGLNVNVRLLFSVAQYERVMDAYIRAMERRREGGRPLDRHSVASFFVSRVDIEVDKGLAAIGNTELQGRAGLANARAAYQAFERVFRGERFAGLRAAGCPVQRPLWASTGVKNPATRRRSTSGGSSAPTPSARCRCAIGHRHHLAGARRPAAGPHGDLRRVRRAPAAR